MRIRTTVNSISDIGINTTGDHQTESYLILDTDVAVNSYVVEETTGEVNYSVNQKGNEESIVLWPGGIYGETYLICGHIGTISSHLSSLKLFDLFSKHFVKNSKKIGRYYIGEEAFKISDRVRLITININQPKEYDVKIVQR